MMSKHCLLSAAVLLAATTVTFAAPTVTTVDVNSASAWTTGSGAGSGSKVDYGFNYTSLGVPLAPGSTSPVAMHLQANTGVDSTGGTVSGSAQGITLSPSSVALSGPYYKISALVWLNAPGAYTNTNNAGNLVSSGTGTSQEFTIGVGYTGGTNFRASTSVGGGTGTFFGVANDGGFSATSANIRDFAAWTGGATATSVPTLISDTSATYKAAETSATSTSDAVNPYYVSAFPGQQVSAINGGVWQSAENDPSDASAFTTAGVPSMSWRNFTIERINNTVTFSIDDTLIATLSNVTTGVDAAPSLGFFDATSGIAGTPNSVFALVANYSVTVPEPTSVALALPAVALLARRRRA